MPGNAPVIRLPFVVRDFTPDDATAADEAWQQAFGGLDEEGPGVEEALLRGALVLSQTGSRILIAERAGRLCGVVRWWDEEGVAWFAMLAASEAGAGRALVRRVEQAAQDRGFRLARAVCSDWTALPDYFGRLGYLTVGRADNLVTVEKRLPLLTVREQRRGDGEAIAALTGEDSWPFDQGTRPGWFVLADGQRIAGVVAAKTGRTATATVTAPVVAAGYDGRALELWMIERAATWAATNGCVSADVPASASLRALERELEDRRWFRDGEVYRKDLSEVPLEG